MVIFSIINLILYFVSSYVVIKFMFGKNKAKEMETEVIQ